MFEQKIETYDKNLDCYNKTVPQGPPFPTNFTNLQEIKQFLCQKDFERIDKEMDKCVKQSKEEEDEEEKKTEECLKNLEEEAKKLESS